MQPRPAGYLSVDLDRWREAGSSEVDPALAAVASMVATAADAAGAQHRMQQRWGTGDAGPTPLVVGIAGGVAVGKTTLARTLQTLVETWDPTPTVRIVSTDSFLHPNAVLDASGLGLRKGFPESYDRAALLAFLAALRSGGAAAVPVYSHVLYDVVPDEVELVDGVDVVILEGLDVLQPVPGGRGTGASAEIVSDHLDLSIYLDADERHIEEWFVRRFAELRRREYADERAFYRQFAGLTDSESDAIARWTWSEINLRNLREHIAPTRTRADVILVKDGDHRAREVLVRAR